MIEVQDLQKHFGTVRAVEQVSFTAPDAAITGLLGPNGAGKSTTLRMICGVVAPHRGQIRVDGDASPNRRALRLGALLEDHGLYVRLTARENVQYFGQLCGLRRPQVDRRVAAVLERLGIAALADRSVSGLSQGERMRVALARALVHAPSNLVLDEPTNGLDVLAVREFRNVLGELRRCGVCIVLSSHLLEEVRLLCDQVVIVARGRVAARGSCDEICRDSGCAPFEDAFVRLIT